ncbi:hypothetical protein BOTBODRAFT_30426 [Botryobasidium botryosum FD-172 SS1]|uniref:Peptidase A1 domain-containing protein n=1 Tax=Botryobasidium botryosum (strain FD-172 SS1) TaxID=930990 RepID=A0A067MMN6_BOTB1|nr:hypothetical protein BOTBODRAFT_30426 [Botryobasidium botryosum FD-172 SS1]
MPAAAILVSLLSLSSVFALPTQSPGVAIPIQKRVSSTAVPGVADIASLKAQLIRLSSKYENNFAAYERNTGVPHPLAPSQARKQAAPTGLPLTDAQEVVWFGSISVGTPPKTFAIDFDTGSSDLFVPGSDCQNCGNHPRYDRSASSTSKDLKRPFTLQYGSGESDGDQVTDTVTVAGLTATGQTLGVATNYSSSFASSPTDGLMGLAYPSLSGFNATPTFNTLIAQKAVPAGVFSFLLAESGSELYLGGANKQRYTGDISWNKVTKEAYWQIAVASANVAGKAVVPGFEAIVDSGTTLIVGDTASVKKFWAQIPGAKEANDIQQGYFSFPCSNVPKDVSFTIGDKTILINPQWLNLGAVSQGSTQCVGGIVALDGVDFWILGDVLMRNAYVTFDFDNNRVGFATLAAA